MMYVAVFNYSNDRNIHAFTHGIVSFASERGKLQRIVQKVVEVLLLV